MSEEFSSSQPIYQQIVGRICRQIARGALRPGEKLASVRDMALQFGVNPNTIQRVNSELERMNVVETRRGQGTFVTEERDHLTLLRKNLMTEEIEQFVLHMKELGFNPDDMLHGLEQYFQEHDDLNQKEDE